MHINDNYKEYNSVQLLVVVATVFISMKSHSVKLLVYFPGDNCIVRLSHAYYCIQHV